MLKRIDVYKTQGAELTEGGTAGVIDVRTNRPFDFKGRQLSLALREEHRDKAKSWNPDVSGMVSDRFSTPVGEIGVLFGLSHQRGTYQDEVGWVAPPFQIPRTGNTVDGVPGGTGTITGTDVMGRVLTYGTRKRDATNFAVQWRPKDNLEFHLEGFRTLIKHDAESDFFVGVLPHWIPGATITTVPNTNYMSTFSHPSGDPFTLSSTQARRDYSRGEQYALGGRWDATDSVRVTGEFAHTNSNYRRSNPILDLTWGGVKPVDARIVNGGGWLDYPGGGVADPANFRIFQLFDQHNHAESDMDDGRLDVNWDVDKGMLKELGAGVRMARRHAQAINEKDGFRGQTPAALRVPVSTIPGLACLSHPTGGNYGFSQFVTPCRDFLLNNLDQVRALATGSSAASPEDPMSFYSDVEKTQAMYLKARLGTRLGGVGVDGTFGVRVVRTEQTINANRSVTDAQGGTTITPVTEGGTSTDVLPSMALKFTLRPDLIARVVAGKSIQRPNFADYNPGLRLYIANGSTSQINTGVAGNPALKPVESRNVDASLEWYFNRTGSLTFTAFRHDFKNFLVWKQTPEFHGGVEYQVTRPYNAQEANLKGFEVGYRQFFDKLPGAFSGLGMEANWTHMKGGMKDVASGEVTDFPGMSKNAYNLVGLYEKGPWSARLAYNWRSKFVAEYNYRANQGMNLVVDPLRWLDASLGYKINDNLTVSIDGNNLLNQDYHDYHSVPEQPRDVRRYDRTIGVSLRVKL